MKLSFRLCDAPTDLNQYATEFNKKHCKVSVVGSKVVVDADMINMVAFKSTNEAQGTAKWVGLLIGVEPGEDLTQYTFNGSAITSNDVNEAKTVGGNPWEIVLWLKADIVKYNPKTITIAKSDASVSVTYSLEIHDTSIDFHR